MVAGIAYEDLVREVTPLLGKYAARAVVSSTHRDLPGLEYEDVMQELRLIVWHCQSRYTQDKASFLNYLMASCQNRIRTVVMKAYQAYPITALRCRTCDRTRPVEGARGGLCQCGGTTWVSQHDIHAQASLDAVTEAEDDTPEYLLMTEDPAFAAFEYRTDLGQVLESVDVDTRAAVAAFLTGNRKQLRAADWRQLWAAGSRTIHVEKA